MLNQEISKQKGENIPDEEEDRKPFIQVSTHIDDNYVDDNDLKIEIHRKINTIDSREKMDSVRKELEDRFGKLNEDMILYMYEEWFENIANKIGIEKVVQTKNYIELYFNIDFSKKIDMEELFMESFKITPMFRFKSTSTKIIIILDTIKLEKSPLYYLIDLVEKIKYISKNSID